MSNRPSILVIMCTYNGEKYLEQQIDSILNQKDVDVFIKAFDDCSTDNTTNILKKYSKKYSNFKYFINNKNKGYTNNFLDGIRSCKDDKYEYYSLSDQDDVWEENKLINGINLIKDNKNKNGCLYSSNLKVTDENLNIKKILYGNSNIKNELNGTLVSAYHAGCTSIFNKLFLQHFCKHKNINAKFHDWWLGMIAIYTADYIYDKNAYILYRQHSNNSLGAHTKKSKSPFKIFKKSEFIKTFINEYYDDIYKDKINILELASNYRNSFKSKIKLLFCSKIKGRKFIHTLSGKFEILFNRY